MYGGKIILKKARGKQKSAVNKVVCLLPTGIKLFLMPLILKSYLPTALNSVILDSLTSYSVIQAETPASW